MCNENKGEKSKEPMGTNTQEGPTVQKSAGDLVWIAVFHQPGIVLTSEKF